MSLSRRFVSFASAPRVASGFGGPLGNGLGFVSTRQPRRNNIACRRARGGRSLLSIAQASGTTPALDTSDCVSLPILSRKRGKLRSLATPPGPAYARTSARSTPGWRTWSRMSPSLSGADRVAPKVSGFIFRGRFGGCPVGFGSADPAMCIVCSRLSIRKLSIRHFCPLLYSKDEKSDHQVAYTVI